MKPRPTKPAISIVQVDGSGVGETRLTSVITTPPLLAPEVVSKLRVTGPAVRIEKVSVKGVQFMEFGAVEVEWLMLVRRILLLPPPELPISTFAAAVDVL
jgi:hypothetical protein